MFRVRMLRNMNPDTVLRLSTGEETMGDRAIHPNVVKALREKYRKVADYIRCVPDSGKGYRDLVRRVHDAHRVELTEGGGELMMVVDFKCRDLWNTLSNKYGQPYRNWNTNEPMLPTLVEYIPRPGVWRHVYKTPVAQKGRTCSREERQYSHDGDTMGASELDQEPLAESHNGVIGDCPSDSGCTSVEYDMDSEGNPVGVIDIRPLEITGEILAQPFTPVSPTVTECSIARDESLSSIAPKLCNTDQISEQQDSVIEYDQDIYLDVVTAYGGGHPVLVEQDCIMDPGNADIESPTIHNEEQEDALDYALESHSIPFRQDFRHDSISAGAEESDGQALEDNWEQADGEGCPSDLDDLPVQVQDGDTRQPHEEVTAVHSWEGDSMTSQHGDDVTADVEDILVYIEGGDTQGEEDTVGHTDENTWKEHNYFSRIKLKECSHAYCVSTNGRECKGDSAGDEGAMNKQNEDPDEKVGVGEVNDHNYCITRKMGGAEETSGWDSTDLAGTRLKNMVANWRKAKPREILRKDNKKVPMIEKHAESQSRVSGNMHETEGGDLQPHVGSMTPEEGIDMDSHISRGMESGDVDMEAIGDTTPRNVESGNSGTQADHNHELISTKQGVVNDAKYYRRQSEKGLFECLICGKLHIRRHNMRTHVWIHTGHRPYKCPDCNRAFLSLQGLQQHKKQHENKMHMCTKCDARFAFRFEKQKHIVEVHLYENVCRPIGSRNGDIPAGKAHIPQSAEQAIMSQNRAKAGEFVYGDMAAKDNNIISLEVDSGHCDIQNKDNHITQNTASGNGELTLDTDQIMAHSKQRGTQLQSMVTLVENYTHSLTVNDIEAKYHRLSEKGLFECLICDRTIKSRAAMRRHIRSHTGYMPYKCPDCDRTYYQRAQMRVHMRTHTGHRPYKCSDCNRAFFSLQCLQQHKKQHENKMHMCTKCDARFAFRFEKQKHIVEVHMYENVCRPIGSGNGDIQVRKAHIPQPAEQAIIDENRTKAGEFVNGDMAAKDNTISLEVDSGYCDIQNKDNHITQNTASGNGELTLDTDQSTEQSKQHGTQWRSAAVMAENRTQSPAVNRYDIETKYKPLSEKGLFQCLICDRTSESRRGIRIHIWTHALQRHKEPHEYQKFKCMKCEARFSFRHERRKHMGEAHKNGFQCEYCEKRFPDSRHLQEHTVVRHTGKRPCQCHICGKLSSSKVTLARHLKSHSRGYQCHVCGRCFSLKETLEQHLLLHSGDKPYLCDRCGHRCFTKKALQSHLLVHNK